MQAMKKTFGKRFREAREAAKLIQADIAQVTQTDNQSVSNWERGANWPSVGNLILALQKIGRNNADANYILLLSGRDEKPSPLNAAHLSGCIEIFQEMIPAELRNHIPPNEYAALITDIYQRWPESGELPMAEVINITKAVKAKYEGRHGGKIKESPAKPDRRRTKARPGTRPMRKGKAS